MYTFGEIAYFMVDFWKKYFIDIGVAEFWTGADIGSGYEQYVDILIHAPAKGATPFISIVSLSLVISIHAPAKGATAIYRNIYRKPYYIYVILSLFLQ